MISMVTTVTMITMITTITLTTLITTMHHDYYDCYNCCNYYHYYDFYGKSLDRLRLLKNAGWSRSKSTHYYYYQGLFITMINDDTNEIS